MRVDIIQRKGSSHQTTSRIIENMKDARIITGREERARRTEILFRFGNRRPVRGNYVINTIHMIMTTNNKPLTRRLLRDADVSIPRTFFSKDEILRNRVAPFPLIGQPTYHHGGSGIVISRNINDLRRDMTSTHWAEIIRKDREWRVYVFFGRVIGVEEKVPTHPQEVAWNHALGNSTFHALKWNEYPLQVCLLAIQAANAIGIDFSAVDIISERDRHYVLELNTSPSCSAPRCRCIARALNWVRYYIQENDRKPEYLTVPSRVRSYKDIIHPCMKVE